MSEPLPQLTLDLFTSEAHEFATFDAAANAETVRALEHWSTAQGAPVIYLWGAPASGKSHLLQAAVRAAGAVGARAMYLPLTALAGHGPQILDGLEHMDCIAIDDLARVRGDAAWEQRLFHFYNALLASGGRLLWASGASPASPPFVLRDLASRLSASLVYQVHAADDATKARVLVSNAHRRGLELTHSVVAFIMRRERRDLATLARVLDDLDRASLRDGRALTIPFVREVLAARDVADRV